jgi:hypothetical protein
VVDEDGAVVAVVVVASEERIRSILIAVGTLLPPLLLLVDGESCYLFLSKCCTTLDTSHGRWQWCTKRNLFLRQGAQSLTVSGESQPVPSFSHSSINTVFSLWR